MRRWLGQYTLTLSGLVVTFILEIFSNFVLDLPNSDQFLIIAIGLMATLVIAAIENEVPKLFETQLDNKLEIYRLLTEVKDDEFHKWAKEIVEDCKYKLNLLAKGEFRSQMGASRDAGRLYLAKENLRAVYLSTVYQSLGFYSWTTSPEEQRYYQENIDAIKRHIPITRIFILRKNKPIDQAGGSLIDPKIFDIMIRQQNDGIKVRIAWEDEIASLAGLELFRDFIIIDNLEVDAREYTPDGNYEVVIWRNTAKIQHYIKVFSLLHRFSSPFSNFLENSIGGTK